LAPDNANQEPDMPTPLKIDFVSDVVCPWCAVGLYGLTRALDKLKDEGVTATLAFQPFELNPHMAPEGENIVEHIGKKYGSTPQQSAENRAMIRERAATVGFDMNMTDQSRIWNTFDAHRLLHWAGEVDPAAQRRLKETLLGAHFTSGRALNDADVLADAAARAGLDEEEARAVLASDRYAREVRDAEELWRSRGINSVPAVVINDKYLISGGQPAEVFEESLRRIAAEG
jgi:predicted DsbA family dithiol-disulfide isomerase